MTKVSNHWLSSSLERYRGNIAMIENDRVTTFDELLEELNTTSIRLAELGITKGSRVVLIGDYGCLSTAVLISLIIHDAVVIPMTRSTARGREKLQKICAAEWVVEIEEGIKPRNFSIEKLEPSEPIEVHPYFLELEARNSPGLILFTSGTTGEPKAVVHDFSLLLEKFRRRGHPLRTLNFLLFDHWGGLNTLFHTLMSGGVVACPTQRNPDYICELIEKYELELLPASPSFLNILLVSEAHKRHNLTSLTLITYGAEPMPETTLMRIRRELPLVELRQTYGLIELGVLRSKSQSSDSLLVKIGGDGYQVRVVDGKLEIKAKSSMLGYLNAPSPFTDDGYFMTGDRVEQVGDYFRILGRDSEQINVGGEKVFPVEVEEVLLEFPLIIDAVVFGQTHPISGKIVCADVVRKPSEHQDSALRVMIRKHCNERLESFKVPVKIRFVEGPLSSDRQKRTRLGRINDEQ